MKTKSTNLNQLDILQLIQIELDVVQHSSKTYRSVDHDSLVIWPGTNTFSWFSQNISGGPFTWLTKVMGYSPAEIKVLEEDQSLFRSFKKVLEQEFVTNFPIGNVVSNDYVASRNVTFETQKYFGIEKYNKDILIPLFGYSGNRVGSMVRRSDTDLSWLKYRKIIADDMCPLWPFKFVPERYDHQVIIFEGAWSVMRWWQVAQQMDKKFLPMALLGTGVSKASHILYNVDDAIFVLDNDENKSGLNVKKRIQDHANHNKSWRFIMPDVYPDEMSDRQIKGALQQIGI